MPFTYQSKGSRMTGRLLSRLLSPAIRFCAASDGQIAMIAALAAPVLIVGVGLAVDLSTQTNKKSELQNMLDTAVLAGASVPGANDETRVLEARRMFAAALAAAGIAPEGVTASFQVREGSVVRGQASTSVKLALSNAFFSNSARIEAAAEAEFKAPRRGGGCIHVLADTSQALLLNSGASIAGRTCTINVHSTSNPAFIMNAGVTLDIAKLCVRGTQFIRNGGTVTNLEPGCAVPADPLAGVIPEPAVPSGCETSGVYEPGNHTLRPGVHCAPTFNGSPTLTFQPGLHIIRGRMIVNNGSTIIADGVTFYFPDTDSEIRANGALTMRAKAPTTGPYAGILMFETTSDAANNARKTQYVFNGSNGEELEGAIYLPNRDVTYNSTTNVRGNKTTIVVNTMIVNSANWTLEGSGSTAGGDTVVRLRE
jgi:Flp pilus assembly protein TadG